MSAAFIESLVHSAYDRYVCSFGGDRGTIVTISCSQSRFDTIWINRCYWKFDLCEFLSHPKISFTFYDSYDLCQELIPCDAMTSIATRDLVSRSRAVNVRTISSYGVDTCLCSFLWIEVLYADSNIENYGLVGIIWNYPHAKTLMYVKGNSIIRKYFLEPK